MTSKNNLSNYWYFPKRRPTDLVGNTSTISNFNKEDKEITLIFFREVIQNILDARLDKKTSDLNVKIKLLTNRNGVKVSTLNKYCGELDAYLKAAGHRFSTDDPKNRAALVIEEFGTTGLTGETDDAEMSEHQKEQRWNNFWNGEALEVKGSTSLGRRGQGKVTKHLISEVSTVFGLSNQSTDDGKKELLMGKCIFKKTFDLENKKFLRHSFFCDKTKDRQGEVQHIPIKSKKVIEGFKKDFQIERKEEFGTSWVIPFVNTDRFTKENIINNIVSEFYIAIINNDISFNIMNEIINSENIEKIIKKFKIFENDTNGFVKWSIDSIRNKANIIKLGKKWFNTTEQPANENSILGKSLNDLQRDLSNNRTISLSVPIPIRKKKEQLRYSNLNVFLKYCPNISRTEEKYVRDCLMIDDEKWLYSVPGKFFGLAYAKDDDLIEFLGDAETASHLSWNQKEEKLKENFEDYQITLAHVRRSLPCLAMLLSGQERKVHDDVFNDLISIPQTKNIKSTNDSKIKPINPHPRLPKKDAIFNINQIESQINIEKGLGFDQLDRKKAVLFEFAYSLLSETGNAFREYFHFDFDFSKERDFPVISHGCRVLHKDLNKMQIEISDPDNFMIKIDGFTNDKLLVKWSA